MKCYYAQTMRENRLASCSTPGPKYVMHKIWDWAKEKLTTEEIKNEMLLHTDNDGRTTWETAAYLGQQAVMQNIWVLAKENLTTEEIKNEMILRTDNDGSTDWHLEA
jgi:hypothetical protein